MLFSVRIRRVLQVLRAGAAVVIFSLVVGFWAAPAVVGSLWPFAAIILFGFPAVIFSLVLKADDERRAKVR